MCCCCCFLNKSIWRVTGHQVEPMWYRESRGSPGLFSEWPLRELFGPTHVTFSSEWHYLRVFKDTFYSCWMPSIHELILHFGKSLLCEYHNFSLWKLKMPDTFFCFCFLGSWIQIQPVSYTWLRFWMSACKRSTTHNKMQCGSTKGNIRTWFPKFAGIVVLMVPSQIQC